MVDWGQVLPIVLGLVGVLFGGWRDRVANRAVAERKTAEANADLMRADAEQQSVVTKLVARQMRLLEQTRQDRLQYDEKLRQDALARDTANQAELQRISRLFSDVRNGEANIHNTLAQIASIQQQIFTSISSIPAAVAQSNVEAMQTLGAELAASIKEHLAHEKLERELYPFPANDDPRWRREWIKPLVPDATIHKDHRFSEDVKLKKPCATINPEGEEVLLIEPTDIDCLMVIKEDCFGFLPRYSVKIGKPNEHS